MTDFEHSDGAGWWIWVLLGGLMLLGGIVALANPLPATFTAVHFAGWIILATGLIQLFDFIWAGSWTDRLWSGVFSVGYLWLGISLLLHPFEGVIALTVLVALGLMFSGIGKLLFAFGMRSTQLFWPFLLSAALSILLALMIFFNFPQVAAVLLGLMLAFELVLSGVTVIAFAFWLRSLRQRAT
jgi:uncharacterized membrane protein HdeD (DUF308 family)